MRSRETKSGQGWGWADAWGFKLGWPTEGERWLTLRSGNISMLLMPIFEGLELEPASEKGSDGDSIGKEGSSSESEVYISQGATISVYWVGVAVLPDTRGS